jgi:hypothetical protein
VKEVIEDLNASGSRTGEKGAGLKLCKEIFIE